MPANKIVRSGSARNLNKINKLILSISSGLVLGLAFNIPELWFLGFVSLVPLFFVLKNTSTLRSAVLHGFTFGLTYFGSVLLFLFSAHPLDWMGIENTTVSLIGIFIIWITYSITFALGPALFTGVIHKLKNSNFLFFFIPTLWVLTEIFQSTLFSIVVAGEGGLIGPHWTAGFLGYILAENTFLISLAALGGVYALSFVLILINTVVYKFIYAQKISRPEALTVIITLALTTLFFSYSPDPVGEKSVAAFYTDFKPVFLQDVNEQEKQFDETDRLFRALAAHDEHFDIVALPENTFYFSRLPEISMRYRLDSLSKGGEVLIIDSVRTNIPGPDESKMIFINTENDGVTSRTKRMLVPQGEYLSYSVSFLGKLFLGDDWHKVFRDMRSLRKGEEMVLGSSGDTLIGALFCLEVVTPALYRAAAKDGAMLLVNTASHSVFTDSKNLELQILKNSKLRAVENGRYFVQAGNRVPSFVINHKGELIKETGRVGSTILKATLPTFDHRTPFTVLGTEGVFVFFFLFIISLFWLEKSKIRK